MTLPPEPDASRHTGGFAPSPFGTPTTQDGEPQRVRLIGLCAILALAALFVAVAFPRAWLNDDAFITFRYAAHLARGQGFVWNTLEPQRVEGSSSLAWTLLNAAALGAGSDPLRFSQLLGLAVGTLTLVVVWLGAWRVLGVSPLVALAAPALLCLQRQWVLWSVSGMETAMGALFVVVSTLYLLHEARQLPSSTPSTSTHGAVESLGARRSTGLTSGILFFVATLVRPEAPLLHLGAGLGVVAALRSRASLRLVLISGGAQACGLVLLTLGRLAYFGQALPNTFYAKVGSLQVGRGARYLGEFLWQNHAWLWLALVLMALPFAWKRQRLAPAVLLAQVAVWCGWLVGFGGGQWEFRLLVPVLPALALLLAIALATLGAPRVQESSVQGSTGGRQQGLRLRHAGVAVTITVIGLSQWHVLRTPFRPFGDLFPVEQLDEMARYMGIEATLLSRYMGPETRICTGWAGILPYLTDAWHFDPWGLNDPEIARRPMDTSRVVFHQRHAAWSDVVANDVAFCDVFNHFLFPQAFDPRQPRTVVPWVDAGIPIYSAVLPEGHFWIFASALPRAAVETHLSRLGLRLESVHPLPSGWPRLGQ